MPLILWRGAEALDELLPLPDSGQRPTNVERATWTGQLRPFARSRICATWQADTGMSHVGVVQELMATGDAADRDDSQPGAMTSAADLRPVPLDDAGPVTSDRYLFVGEHVNARMLPSQLEIQEMPEMLRFAFSLPVDQREDASESEGVWLVTFSVRPADAHHVARWRPVA